jgi:hypothetical protein
MGFPDINGITNLAKNIQAIDIAILVIVSFILGIILGSFAWKIWHRNK